MIIYDCIKLMLDKKRNSGINVYESLNDQATTLTYDVLDDVKMEGGSPYELPDDRHTSGSNAYQNTQFT